jgi:hypothetical protein
MTSTHLPRPPSIPNQLNAETGGASVSRSPVVPVSPQCPNPDTGPVNSSVPLSPVVPASSQYLNADTGGPVNTDVSLSPVVSTSSQHPNADTGRRVNASASLGPTSSRRPESRPRWYNLGWIKYKLPIGTVYYYHPTRRVTADVDLLSDNILEIVTAFLERQDGGSASRGMELWIRWGPKSSQDLFTPMGHWVDHRKRAVESCANKMNRNTKGKSAVADDREWYKYFVVWLFSSVGNVRIDIESRYWAFVETHPAHVSLPARTKVEAMEVLRWAWAGTVPFVP